MRFQVILLVLICLMALDPCLRAEPALDELLLGEQVSGQPVDPDDLIGKVVVIHQWGFDQGLCVQSVQQLSGWSRTYDPRTFLVLSFSYWELDPTLAMAAQSSSDRYAVFVDSALPNAEMDGKARCFVFDGSGKLTFDVRPADLSKAAVNALIAACPHTRFGNFETCEREAEQLSECRSPLAKTLASLRSVRHGTDRQRREEADDLLRKFSAFLDRRQQRIVSDCNDRPLRAREWVERLARVLKGDPLADAIAAIKTRMSTDRAYLDGLAAAEQLLKIRAVIDHQAPSWINDVQLRQKTAAALMSLISQFPGTSAAEEAATLVKRWKLSP